jgi:23S rRNA (guanosine2251-2'-O)-methyltransferase
MENLIIGVHPVKIALQKNPQSIKCIYAVNAGSVKKLQPIKNLAKKHGVRMQWVDEKDFPSEVSDLNHQNICAQLKEQLAAIKQFEESDLINLIKRSKKSLLILVLDNVQDPHNLGACLRVADGAGVDAFIIPKDNAAPITTVVRKVAAGAAESVDIYRVTNVSRILAQLKEEGVWITGLAGEATQYYDEIDYASGHTAIVMGNEGNGIRHKIKEHCDFLVKIPMQGHVESLNVSVATGIVLYEAVKQRAEYK